MKERPILFSGPMVRAILEGRKCMTRRVCKIELPDGIDYEADPEDSDGMCWSAVLGANDRWGKLNWLIGAKWGARPLPKVYEHLLPPCVCPYGNKGDRLWVRETFWHREAFHADYLMDYRYCATEPTPPGSTEPNETLEGYWRKMTSLFMPRDASRITLEVTGVRVERLQEISEKDAIAEGIFEFNGLGIYGYDKTGTPGLHCQDSAKDTFRCLWDMINGRPKLPKNVNSHRYHRIKRWMEKHPPCDWAANPWVWVVEFRKAEG